MSRPRLTLTDEQRATYHKALQASGGNISKASAALGIDFGKLRLAIRRDFALSALLGKQSGAAQELDATDAAGRERLDLGEFLISDEDRRLAESVEKADTQLAKVGWEGVGITDPEELAMLKGFEQLIQGSILTTIDTSHGAMSFALAKVSAEFQRLDEKLKIAEAATGEEVTQEELDSLFSKWAKAAEMLRKLNTDATRAAHVRVLIQDKARLIQNREKKHQPRRAAWKKVRANAKDSISV